MPHVLHLLPARLSDPETWDGGVLAPESLTTEGFVHATGDEDTLLAVADALYADAGEPLAVLVLDTEAIGAEVRWEAPHPAPPPGTAADTLFPHIYGPVPAQAVVERRFLRPDPHGGYAAVVARTGTAALLGLLPHPEGGWFGETWRTTTTVAPQGYPGERSTATGIHFLLPPGEASRWHRVRSDELWVFNRGVPLALRLGGTGARPEDPREVVLGADLESGQRVQCLVPAGAWQDARPLDGETLVTCIVSPGFDFADFEVEPD